MSELLSHQHKQVLGEPLVSIDDYARKQRRAIRDVWKDIRAGKLAVKELEGSIYLADMPSTVPSNKTIMGATAEDQNPHNTQSLSSVPSTSMELDPPDPQVPPTNSEHSFEDLSLLFSQLKQALETSLAQSIQTAVKKELSPLKKELEVACEQKKSIQTVLHSFEKQNRTLQASAQHLQASAKEMSSSKQKTKKLHTDLTQLRHQIKEYKKTIQAKNHKIEDLELLNATLMEAISDDS